MAIKNKIGFLVLILLIITIVSFTISGLIFVFSGINFMNPTTMKDFDIEKKFDVKLVKNISIDLSSTEVNIIPVETNEIKIHFYGKVLKKKLPEFLCELDENKLNIKFKENFVLNIGNYNESNISYNTKLDVYLPKIKLNNFILNTSSGNINGSKITSDKNVIISTSGCITIDNITGDSVIESTSGVIKINSFKSNELTARATSGGIIMSDINVIYSNIKTSSGCINLNNSTGNFDLKATSGCIKCESFKGDKLNVELTSGNLDGENIITKDTNYKSSSGCMRVKKFTGNLDFESTSGVLNVQYEKFNNNITARATSGTIDINLPENSLFNVKFISNSGRLNSNFNISASLMKKNSYLEGNVGNSQNQININTTSGDGNINK